MLHPASALLAQSPSSKINPERLEEIEEQFVSYCEDGNKTISTQDIMDVLLSCGEKVPAYQIRSALEKLKLGASGNVNFEDFKKIFEEVATAKMNPKLVPFASKGNMQVTGGQSFFSAEGTQHSYDDDDRTAFAEWVNGMLEKDAELAGYHPISLNSSEALFESLKDGIILCKLVNYTSPGTIDERAINKTKLNVYTIHENITLALNSASSIGCGIINIGPEDILNGTPHLVLGLLWQLLRISLLTTSSVKNLAGLENLLEPWETREDLLRMPSEALLLKWVNYHVKKGGSQRTAKNFKKDFQDSEIYAALLKQICPRGIQLDLDLPEGNTTEILEKRAVKIINAATKMKCRRFIKARDIVNEKGRLNLAFLCHCFQMYPNLDDDDSEGVQENINETRDEKAFRNWINSLGVEPFVFDLHHELQDGWVLLQVLDIVARGVRPIALGKVNKPPFKRNGANMKRLENCNNVIRICMALKMSTVGIAGSDIRDGNIKLTLAIIWQVMKLYTLSLLQKCNKSNKPITESQIIKWANMKLLECGKHTRISSFKDSTIATSIVILDLIDSIRSNSVNYSLVKAGNDQEEKISNAHYAISLARKIGARVYALPEDIVEVKPRMIMTIFACLMLREMIDNN